MKKGILIGVGIAVLGFLVHQQLGGFLHDVAEAGSITTDTSKYDSPPSTAFDNAKRGLSNTVFKILDRSPLAPYVNRFVLNTICSKGGQRPYALSTMADYTSWESLSDYTWNSRHMPSKSPPDLPPVEQLAALFKRPNGVETKCPKSMLLFPTFAQYLTDGFIRTMTIKTPDAQGFIHETSSYKQNTATHEIDLIQLYGRFKAQTDVLRLNSENKGRRGLLKTQVIQGEDWAPFLYLPDGTVDPQFAVLDTPAHLDMLLARLPSDAVRLEYTTKIFAFGGDRANSVPQVAAMNTLFLREHNRLASEIEKSEPLWDDERVFQTARNINIVIFCKIIVEDYINHISSSGFRYRVDPGPWMWNAPWNKRNRISVEFSLLYRWHSLVPGTLNWDGEVPIGATLFNNNLLVGGKKVSLSDAFVKLSNQSATSLSAFNTAPELEHLEVNAIKTSRALEVVSYSDYMEYLSLPRPKTFEDVTTHPEVLSMLRKLYKSVDHIELYVGLTVANHKINSPFSFTMIFFVALDAFSQVLTNPLLSENVWNERTYGTYGWKLLAQEQTIKGLVERNSPEGIQHGFIGFTNPNWKLK